MMFVEEAYAIAESNMKDFTIIHCYEYDSVYVFGVTPKGQTENHKTVANNMCSVNKETKEFHLFSPLQMSVDEYRRGKEIELPNAENQDELAHHGILGMKWGIRRYQNKDGTLTAAGKKRYDKEMEKIKAEERILKNKQKTKAKIDELLAKKKANEDLKEELSGKKKSENSEKKTDKDESEKKKIKIEDLSNEELQAKIDRLNLEKKYRELLKEPVSANKSEADKKEESKFKKWFKESFSSGASDIGKQASSYLMGKGVNATIGKLFFNGDQVVNPKKAQKAK